MPDKSGRLTHDEMVEVISSGGSVLFGGAVITDPTLLPTEAQLAQTDEDRAKVMAENTARIAELQAQNEALAIGAQVPPPAPKEDAKPSEVEEDVFDDEPLPQPPQQPRTPASPPQKRR